VPESRRRLETRLLIRNTSGVLRSHLPLGTNLTNAFLVAEDGTNETFTNLRRRQQPSADLALIPAAPSV